MDIKKIARDLTTGRDNATQDLGRWSWIVSTAAILAGTGWNAYKGQLVDVMGLAQALALVVAGHGAALWAKRDTEPT